MQYVPDLTPIWIFSRVQIKPTHSAWHEITPKKATFWSFPPNKSCPFDLEGSFSCGRNLTWIKEISRNLYPSIRVEKNHPGKINPVLSVGSPPNKVVVCWPVGQLCHRLEQNNRNATENSRRAGWIAFLSGEREFPSRGESTF